VQGEGKQQSKKAVTEASAGVLINFFVYYPFIAIIIVVVIITSILLLSLLPFFVIFGFSCDGKKKSN